MGRGRVPGALQTARDTPSRILCSGILEGKGRVRRLSLPRLMHFH
jgi:hypothetical protein